MRARARVATWAAAGVLGVGVITGAVFSQLGAASAVPSAASVATSPISTSTSSPSPGTYPNGTHMHGDRLGLERLGGRELHGEFTVRTKSGATEVVALQNGAVTSTSTRGGTDTVTVKSTDGFTSAYTVTATTRVTKNGATSTFADLKAGDTVRVIGTSANGTLTATAIRDGKARMANRSTAPSTPASPASTEGGTTT